jgi:hypothetical protein
MNPAMNPPPASTTAAAPKTTAADVPAKVRISSICRTATC